MTKLVRNGQAIGEIRDGAASALALLAAVLVNEYVLSEPLSGSDLSLTRGQFHEVFDGALRADPVGLSLR